MQEFVIKGRVIKVGDNVDTDVIIPSKYLVYTDPEILGRHCLEPLIPNFYEKAKEGVILVAGRNFGMGSSREQAAIFFRNAINNGLPVLVVPGVSRVVQDGDVVEVRPIEGKVIIEGKGELQAQKLDPKVIEILKEGGLIPYLRKALGLSK